MTSRYYSIPLLAAVLAATAAVSVQAAPLTRAEVQAEAARALRAGELDHRGDDYMQVLPQSRQTPAQRADVKAPRERAKPVASFEDKGDSYRPAEVVAAAPLTRAEVKAEVLRAMTNGELNQRDEYYGYTATWPNKPTVGYARAARATETAGLSQR